MPTRLAPSPGAQAEAAAAEALAAQVKLTEALQAQLDEVREERVLRRVTNPRAAAAAAALLGRCVLRRPLHPRRLPRL